MVLAHQYLGQLDAKLQEAFGANTSIKLAGGVSDRDARSLAPMLNCQFELIKNQPKGSFAAFVRGTTGSALPLSFPFGYLERLDQMDDNEMVCVRAKMRERYAVHISELAQWQVTGNPVEAPDFAGDSASAAQNADKTDEPRTTPSRISIEPTEEW